MTTVFVMAVIVNLLLLMLLIVLYFWFRRNGKDSGRDAQIISHMFWLIPIICVVCFVDVRTFSILSRIQEVGKEHSDVYYLYQNNDCSNFVEKIIASERSSISKQNYYDKVSVVYYANSYVSADSYVSLLLRSDIKRLYTICATQIENTAVLELEGLVEQCEVGDQSIIYVDNVGFLGDSELSGMLGNSVKLSIIVDTDSLNTYGYQNYKVLR